tara:strand:- start:35712 stop:36035 length:324 start_codon:yes stop_codon:yes gene_type:complete
VSFSFLFLTLAGLGIVAAAYYVGLIYSKTDSARSKRGITAHELLVRYFKIESVGKKSPDKAIQLFNEWRTDCIEYLQEAELESQDLDELIKASDGKVAQLTRARQQF